MRNDAKQNNSPLSIILRMLAETTSANVRPTRRRQGGFLLASVGFATMASFRAALEPYGVQPRQFATMRALGEREGQSQRALSEALHIPPSRLVALLDDLEEQGLVERRPDPADRRVRCLYLTETGDDLLEKLYDAAGRHERRAFAGLTAAERRQLDSLLSRVADNLALEPDEHPGMRA